MRHANTAHQVGFRPRRDEGQVSVLVLLALALFVLLFVGFGVDMTNLYFHRQMAQGAADAACQAGAMDMFVTAAGASMGGFTAGTAFTCTSSSAQAPCKYARLNGYNSPGLTANTESNKVSVSFPTTVPGVTAPPGALTGGYSFIQVDIVDRVNQYFSSLMSAGKTQDVLARSKCGIILAASPVPIIVMDPTCPHAFQVAGASTVSIVGGPPKSIQVNSDNTTCAAATQDSSGCSSNGTIDLSKAGPNFTGGIFGVFGAPLTPPPNFIPGTTGQWMSPAAPIQDPFKLLPPPTMPSAPTVPPDPYPSQCTNLANPCKVAYHTNGCPDLSGCLEFGPGLYTSAINIKNATAIFDPGIYYITGNVNVNCGNAGTGCVAGPGPGQCRGAFVVDSNGVVRPSTVTGIGANAIGGTIFYVSGTGAGHYGSAFFGANAGQKNNGIGQPIDAFDTTRVTCPGGTPPNPPLPATIDGDILLGPCTGTYGDPLGANRGMLFFQDRSNADMNGQPSMNGGGGLLLGGNLYFHNCPESLTAPCAPPPTDYNAFLQLQGNPGSSTYVYGNITTDELITAGNGAVSMQLNPNAKFPIAKVALLQ
jgi:hypothetical protein